MSAEHRVAAGEGPQGRRWVAETWEEPGAKEAPGGGVEYSTAKRTEYQAAGGGEGPAGGGGGGLPAAGPAGVVAPGYQDPDKIIIMPGSETASLEGCQQGPCEGLAGGGGGGGGALPGCGPRGYGFGDES